MDLSGRRVLVTGAASGIGRATALELVRRGATVIAVDRDGDGLRVTADSDPRFVTVTADVTDPADQDAVWSAAGAIDALVNDAGVGWVGLVEDMPLEEIDRIVSVNVTAVLRLTRTAIPHLPANGHVVMIGSVLGVVASPPLTVYSATKFAVRGFSQGLRREVRGRGLYVTEIRPGPVDTPFFDRATGRPQAARVPPFPMISPDRVAAAVRRALERPGRPGYRTISVPRLAGLSQLGALAGGSSAVDLVARLTRGPLVLRSQPAPPVGE